MIKPDIVPKGAHQKTVSLSEIRTSNHAEYSIFLFRILLLKYDSWYGSFCEIHIENKKDGHKVTYIDLMFSRYWLKKLGGIGKLLKYIIMPWRLLDKGAEKLFTAKLWTKLNGYLERNIYPKRKNIYKR